MSIPEEFFITRQGKRYVLFAGLLAEAHQRGLRSIETRLEQVPTQENGMVAISKARVEMFRQGNRVEPDTGEPEQWLAWFDGIGDASPDNVARHLKNRVVAMSETRAKARALRDAVNVGVTALEELADGDEEARQEPPRQELGVVEGGAAPEKGGKKARKSQVDLLRTLAEELRGENGVSRLEARIGKPLTELSVGEADDWIDRLQPEGKHA